MACGLALDPIFAGTGIHDMCASDEQHRRVHPRTAPAWRTPWPPPESPPPRHAPGAGPSLHAVLPVGIADMLTSILGPIDVLEYAAIDTATTDGASLVDADRRDAERPHDAVGQAIQRASRGDYDQWLTHISSAAGCTRPIRLRGHAEVHSTATGRSLGTRPTSDMPDGIIYKPCGNRRARACTWCAETYRADTYHLVRTGITGGKIVPESVASHPCVFATFTAPSFGPVHSVRLAAPQGGGPPRPRICRPCRNPERCPHGLDLACRLIHNADDPTLGQPMCLDCYRHDAQVIWNLASGELWRRTLDRAKQLLGTWAKQHGVKIRVSYAKVAEMQARGVIHFHALIRLDGVDPADPAAIVPPPVEADAQLLDDLLQQAVAATS
ncbi:MAG: replication initiator, partial [Nocardioides sp.]